MAQWAKIDQNNFVETVILMSDDEPNKGLDWILNNFNGKWIETCPNTWAGKHKLGGEPLRKNHASIGFYYDQKRDAFIPPNDYPKSWTIFNEYTCQWEAPIPYPEDGKPYYWDEPTNSWKLV